MTAVPPTRVVTPEAVPLDFELAGIGSRFLAKLIDFVLQGTVLFVLLMALAAGSSVTDLGGGWVVALAFLLIFADVWGYPTAMETLWRGRTLGKAAVGLRVVTREGAPVRFRHAAIRAAMGFVDFIVTYGAAAVLCVLLTRDNQRLGDLVAGTLVLRERTGLRPPSAVTFAVPPGLEGFVATLDVSAVAPDDYAAVRSFLLRAPTLPPPVRADLALRLAAPLAQRVRLPSPPDLPPELFLACVAAAHQRRWATR